VWVRNLTHRLGRDVLSIGVVSRYGRTVRGAVAVLLGAIAAGGCSAARPGADSQQREQARLNLGVVAIEATVGGDVVRSSGIVIDADRGLLLTSVRAVWGATSLRLGTGLGVLHGRLVARAPCSNVAVIETQPRVPGLVALPAGAGAPPGGGELLAAVGRRRAAPELGAYSLLTIPARTAGFAPGNALQLDAPLVPEASGGPLVDRDGRLIGMALSAGDAPGSALPWDTIRQRLAELRPGPRRVYVGWREQYRCARDLNADVRAAHPGFLARDARLDAPVPATRLPGTQRLDAQ
jgi:S1-C subfamily serine protease